MTFYKMCKGGMLFLRLLLRITALEYMYKIVFTFTRYCQIAL